MTIPTSVLPAYFLSVVTALVATGIIIIVARLWLTIRRKSVSDPTVISDPPDVPVTQRSILTASEAKFFRVLQDAVGLQYTIFPQLSLWTLIDTPIKDRRNATALRNRISLKRVDFVLVDLATLKTLMVIELDDRSHFRNDRMERDEFVAGVLNRAGINLVRIQATATYNSQMLRHQLGLTILQDRSA